VLLFPQTGSILTWESYLYVVYLGIMVTELWLLMRADLSLWSRQSQGRMASVYQFLAFGFVDPVDAADKEALRAQSIGWLRRLGLVGIPVALGVHGGTGALFAVVKARPGWNGPLFPLVFIVSALVSGGGLLMFLRSFVHPDPETDHEVLPFLANLTLGFLIFDLALLFLEFLVGLYGGMPDHLAVFRLIAAGPFWYIFWGLQLTVGAVIPIWMLTRKVPFQARRLGLAGILIVVGIFGVRMNIVIPPLAVPVFPGYDQAFHSIRMTARYVPNWIEWLSSLGIIAAAALFVRWGLPRLPMDEHQPYVER
jgi:molybdopterin-containing oxidoreductase family membrane subunit